MKNKLKKTMAFILSALMVFALLPEVAFPASAADPTPLPIYVTGSTTDFSGLVSDSSENTLLVSTGVTTVDGNNYLQLTGTGVGTVVRRSPIQLGNGFSTYFVVNMANQTGGGGDGLCFIVYDSSNGVQSGGSGINLGYSDYDKGGNIIQGDSLAVELDTYCNGQYEDLSGKSSTYHHVAIDTNDWDGGRPNNSPSQDSRFNSTETGANILHSSSADSTSTDYSSPTDDSAARVAHSYSALNDGSDIHVWADLTKNSDGTSEVTVTYGKSSTRSDSSNYSFKRQLSNQNLLDDSVYVGFSASTGSATEDHIVKAWYFSNTPVSGGIDPVPGSYSQAVSTVSVSRSSAINPSTATVMLYDASGTAMSGTADIYVDGSCKITGASVGTSSYVYSLPSGLSVGSHTVQAVATGGASDDDDFSVSSPSVTLGTATLTGGKYYYPSATVTGDNIKTMLISFSENVSLGDEITLPTTTGFTVSTTSTGNSYSKRINIDTTTTGSDNASAVRDYLRGVGFSIVSATQTVSVTVTTESITTDTFYNTDTQHYYQFITYDSGTTGTWTAAYNTAKGKTYMGRTGYLATVKNLQEDQFLYELSGGATGWLGGTILTHGTKNGNYYENFDTASNDDPWYWACGPEIGTTFYTAQEQSLTAESASNSAGYYFNWGSVEPNSANDEQCLTTLVVSTATGYGETEAGYKETVFSWNNIGYDREYNSDGTYYARGYFVEYGDILLGDSGSGSAAFATDSGTLTDPIEIALTTVTQTSVSAYTCGLNLSSSSRMVTISVDSGYFTVPSLGSALTYRGGTNGTSYISTFNTSTQYDSVVFSFANPSAAADLLDDINYTQGSATSQTITATSSAVSPTGNDLYFEGHFYRYVSGGIDWPSAVTAAGATTDSYFGGRGYIATATSQAENSILLRLTDTGGSGSDHWNDAYMGGIWQRNTGTVASPSITRGTDGHEITYANIVSAKNGGKTTSLLPDYSETYGSDANDACNASADGKYVYQHPDTVKYYWIDGPEAGQEIENNVTSGYSPWYTGEPNSGDFVYVGFKGAYWDDQSADVSSSDSGYATISGYIVEFSGYDGGSSAGTVASDTKTVNSGYSVTLNVNDGTVNSGNVIAYTYGTGALLPTDVAKTGFTFGGWYADSSFSGPAMTTISTTDTGAKEYWAKWTAVESDYNYSPSKTITVTETSSELFAGSSGEVLAEANVDNAFSNSVEVKVRDTGENTSSFGFGAGTDVYPFDISLYIKGTNTKTEPASGYAVTISLPIPEDLLDIREKLFIVHKSDSGTVSALTSSLKQINGVWYLVFDATNFSPYALVVRNLASYDTAAGLPYYLNDSGGKVFIGFSADGKYLAPDSETVKFTPNPKSFSDISTHWGKSYIDFVTEREIYVGTGTNVFSPDTGMTRAMFAAVIGRLYERSYGEIGISGVRAFSDCNYDDYYGKYVDWAAKNSIILGVGGGLFQPDRQVTRQEMAAMLYRFAEFIKLSTGISADATLGYSDASSIASWAEDAALYCQETGIITGRTGGSFAPTETATRAEVAAIIQRFVKLALN